MPKLKYPIPPAVGQIRQDPDPRMKGRKVEVVGVYADRARIRSASRTTGISIDTLAHWPLITTPTETTP